MSLLCLFGKQTGLNGASGLIDVQLFSQVRQKSGGSGRAPPVGIFGGHLETRGKSTAELERLGRLVLPTSSTWTGEDSKTRICPVQEKLPN